MKTPREIFLKRHRENLPALDEIRRQVIAEQGRTGILPVTQRTTENALARNLNATIAAETVAPSTSGNVLGRAADAGLVAAGDRQDACPTLLTTLRSWLTLNRVTWGALASAWLMIFALNISAGLGADANEVVRTRADARQVLEGVRHYQAQLALLLFDENAAEEQNDFHEPKHPGPRSDAARPRRDAHYQTTFYA